MIGSKLDERLMNQLMPRARGEGLWGCMRDAGLYKPIRMRGLRGSGFFTRRANSSAAEEATSNVENVSPKRIAPI